MSNTQTSFFGLNEAIERDRIANPPELLVVRKEVRKPREQGHELTSSRLWEPCLTIGIGVAVMMIAAFI